MLIHAQMLRLGEMDVVKLNRVSDAIERSIKMQALLIDDLLDVSRITNGKFKIEFGTVDLAAVVRLALEGVGALAESKSITVEASMAKSIGMMSGDQMRLQQVVENLLTNAIKFTPAGGRVTVALEQVDASAKLEVSDTGKRNLPGVPAPHLRPIHARGQLEHQAVRRARLGLGDRAPHRGASRWDRKSGELRLGKRSDLHGRPAAHGEPARARRRPSCSGLEARPDLARAPSLATLEAGRFASPGHR